MSTRRTLARWLARYIQRPSLALLWHQPTLRVVFEVQSFLTSRRIRGLREHNATLRTDDQTVEVTWMQPPGPTDRGVIVYLHGGGFTIGSPRTHKSLIGSLARATEASGLAVAYRLAPRHPYPAAIDDAMTAYRTLIRQGTRPETIAIAGDSAGGGLAVQMCQRIAAEGLPRPAALALLSPLLDLTFSGDSATTNRTKDYLLPAIWGKRAITQYLDGVDSAAPEVSPLMGDLSCLPPVITHVADNEVLLDDSRRLHDQLQALGIRNELKVFNDLAHVWQLHAGWLPEADQSLERMGKFLALHLRGRQ